MYHVLLAFQCVYRCNDKRGENEDGEEGSKVSGGGYRLRLPGLFYSEDSVLCGESEEDLKGMVGRFVEVRRIRNSLQIKAR